MRPPSPPGLIPREYRYPELNQEDGRMRAIWVPTATGLQHERKEADLHCPGQSRGSCRLEDVRKSRGRAPTPRVNR
jgi:hypothetical protein